MTMEEAIRTRHMVRKYTDRKLPQNIVNQLIVRINENNDKYGVNMKLVTENAEALNPIIKLFLAKGVRNYIVLAGSNTRNIDEKLGYCGADLILYAQALGLNSWWVGDTFSKKGAQKNAGITDADKVTGIIAIGYGATRGVPHKSKTWEEISSYKGDRPEWFINGVNAVLLAPTALNKQAFNIKGEGNKVLMTCTNGAFSDTDLGIGRYHFELGAGKENFEWI